jgi:signal transduction histidine kinase
VFGDSSISAKLTRMNMLVSGTALILACVSFIAYDVFAIRRGMVENISMQAQVAGVNSVTALLFNDPDSANKTLASLSPVPNIISAAIYTADDRPFALFQHSPKTQVPLLPVIPPGKLESYRFGSGTLILARMIVFQDKPLGKIYVLSDFSRLNSGVREYILIATFVLGACLSAALLISPFSRRAIAEPIIHLAEIARVVSRDKNYSVRATATANRDELSVLIESFNGMLSQIQVRDAALQQGHDEMEQRVVERTRELSATNKELEAFAYSVSHDLRAPLRSIDGFSQALLDDYSDRLDEPGRKHLQRVRHAAQRMSRLIDDMLNLSRVTRSPIHNETLNLSAIARDIAEELCRTEPARKVEFTIEDGLNATGDANLLQAAMENLIRNSWKYTSSHVTAKIEFGRMKQNGTSPYFVRDDGAGFDPRYADRLFGAFQRLHTEAEFPGTGIGLATVQRIIHRHGGEIWAEGAVEKGATFYFTL